MKILWQEEGSFQFGFKRWQGWAAAGNDSAVLRWEVVQVMLMFH